MLHKNVVEENDSGMVDHHLPSRTKLPHWTRLNTLDTTRYPRYFEKDKQAYPNEQVASRRKSTPISEDEKPGNNKEDEVHGKRKGAAGSQDEDSNRRLQYLERSMEMLKKQHCEILQSLHQEIDDLKRQNKDLNFKIIMSQRDSKSSLASDVMVTDSDGGKDGKTVPTEEQRRGTEERTGGDDKHGDDNVDDDDDDDDEYDGQRRLNVPSADQREGQDVEGGTVGKRSDLSDLSRLGDLSREGGVQKTQNRELKLDKEEKLDEVKILLLEEELRKHQQRNSCLGQLLEQSEEHRRDQIMTIDSLRYQLAQIGAKFCNDVKYAGHHHSGMHSYVTANHHMNQHMSMLELQNIIKNLQEINDSQSHELEALKSDLRDVLYSHKWTPDAYLIAKAYIAFDDAKAAQKDHSKPLRSTPKMLSKKELEDRGAAAVADNLTLPPLKQTVGNAAVERRKRTRTLQKRRMKDREMMF
ncbi:coiled-coil domain-containing protein 74A-like [Octopus sinensis]|uniref:Coiled-coil domain-containing protein 74A-like n=1 Tax=Octopus sinensis TaxID=2607531 RepID=A0A6P7TU57_9MOLL|nr:coiled-coil domain-containing protein 74A-like [Octopus sinensis]